MRRRYRFIIERRQHRRRLLSFQSLATAQVRRISALTGLVREKCNANKNIKFIFRRKVFRSAHKHSHLADFRAPPVTGWRSSSSQSLTVIVFVESFDPHPYRAASFSDPGWWWYPSESNAPKRLPEIGCDLNAIYALPGTNKVWAVGNVGLIVHSEDGGRTWSQQHLPPSPTESATPDW
ncbi:MAG: hypothetical protein WKF84_16310 [Pyrinomonadaceae bacterium]